MTNAELKSVYDRMFETPAFATRAGVRLLVTGQMMAYFSRLDGNEKGLLAAYRHVHKAIGSQITWYRTEAMRRSRAAAAKDLEAFDVWFGSPQGRRDEYELVLGSGASPGEIGPWGFRFAAVRSSLPELLGYFQFNVPPAFARERPEEFRALARAVFESADFISAHAGLGLSFDPGDLDSDRDRTIRGLCMRFVGLDCPDVLTETEALHRSIMGADWLTFLGKALAEQIGGAEQVRSALGGQATVEALGDRGLMIQAGPAPLLGDRHTQEDVSAYRAVDAVLRPIRAERLHPLPGFDDETDSTAWLERFELQD